MLLAPGVVASGATIRRLVRVLLPLPVRVNAGILGSPVRAGLGFAAA
jgi:hypothetical protein